MEFLLLLLFGFVAGIRHGIDLDHIAAIADITSSQERGKGIWFAALYGLGHGVVVIFLGLLLIVIRQSLPEPIDAIFGKIVGATLILLGLYVFYSLFKHGKNFRLKSRWMLVFDAIQFGYHKLLHNFDLSHQHPKRGEGKYQSKSAFAIGMIHGIGAETPTQVTALATVLGIGGGVKGIIFLLFFVSGIFISNLSVATFSSLGYMQMKKQNTLYVAVGLLTAVFSLVVGTLFLIR